MPKYKLTNSSTSDCIALLHARYDEVHPDTHIGIDRALGLVPANGDLHEWVGRMLDHAAVAPDQELPGLIEALGAVLSIDERPAAELVDERRAAETPSARRHTHGH
jgi:hypothetical protein